MRIHRIHLRNFRGVGVADVEFDIDGVTVIEGDNEIGKSSIMEGLALLLDQRLLDRSGHRRVKSVMPVHRDAGPLVEADISVGQYRFVFAKQWGRARRTRLDVSEPERKQLTGDEAHEEVQRMLDESLDRSLWDALSVEQGAELSLPSFATPGLQAALDAAAGDIGSGEQHETLWDLVAAERDKYWTPTGQQRTNLKQASERLREAKSELADIEQRISAIESDAERASRKASEAEQLREDLVEHESARAAQQACLEAARALEAEVREQQAEFERAGAEHRSAVADFGVREGLIDRVSKCDAEVRELGADIERAAPALAEAQRHHGTTESVRDVAHTAYEEQRQESERADRDREHLRQIIEVRQLSERHQRFVEAQTALDTADEVLDAHRIDASALEELESAELAVVTAQAGAQAGAATVSTSALRDVEFDIDGESVALRAGDERTDHVTSSAVIAVPDALTLTVSAGDGSQELGRRLAEAQSHRRELLSRAGVADLAEARASSRQREAAERDRVSASAAIERELQDLTPDSLANKAERLAARVADYNDTRPAVPALPEDYDAATRLALGLQEAVTKLKAEHDRCANEFDTAVKTLRTEELRHAATAARLDDAELRRGEAETELSTARARVPDADLQARLTTTAATMRQSQAELSAARERLEAADVDSLVSRHENAQAVWLGTQAKLKSCQEALRELQVSLDVRGAAGLHHELDEAHAALDRSSKEHESLFAKARAAELLHKTLKHHRDDARRRYVSPFKQRIEAYGRIVYGDSFEATVGDDLSIKRRTLGGVTLDVDQLSVGAREQLGVIARLACAAIVSPHGGGAPVVLDDALGWSDPSRLQGMGAAINAAGKDCQVIILTCTPGRYNHVGNTKVVPLPTASGSPSLSEGD